MTKLSVKNAKSQPICFCILTVKAFVRLPDLVDRHCELCHIPHPLISSSSSSAGFLLSRENFDCWGLLDGILTMLPLALRPILKPYEPSVALISSTLTSISAQSKTSARSTGALRTKFSRNVPGCNPQMKALTAIFSSAFSISILP